MLGKNLITAAAGNAGGEVLGIEDVFSTWLYTGNGSTQTITNEIDLAGEGGMVWIKKRSTTGNHVLADTARGITKVLNSNSTSGEFTSTDHVSAVTSTGFTVGNDTDTNASSATFASWTFRKAEKFFDVVTYTGTGSDQTISHNLGSTPGCIIVKRTDSTDDWYVYHRSLATATQNWIRLNNTGAANGAIGQDLWGPPTDTTFKVDTYLGLSTSSATYVAYLFAHDAGGFGDGGTESVIKCGSYTGNGSTTPQNISLGWEPQFVLLKAASAGGTNYDWVLIDNMRGLGAFNGRSLFANSSTSEFEQQTIRINSDGFQTDQGNAVSNQSGVTYIYIAIRRGPMKTPTDATKVFNAVISTASLTPYSIGFPTDMAIIGYRSGSANYAQTVGTRLTGDSASLFTSQTVAEKTNAGVVWSFDLQNSFNQQWNGSSPSWNFRRAPSFMDVVAYTGTGVARTVSHNLGVAPELMIVKHRSDLAFTGSNRNWAVYFAPGGASASLNLNTSNAQNTSGFFWNSTNPTDSVFSIDDTVSVNYNGTTYIAYLFATCPGVSKCFNFTGTGTTLQIDCGFASGARFVMIKRTDSTGDWYVWDSARGIISGNDPYLLLNSTAAEVTSTDYIDPYSAGFEISSTAPAAINANGGSYIGLAIA